MRSGQPGQECIGITCPHRRGRRVKGLSGVCRTKCDGILRPSGFSTRIRSVISGFY
jgi:hypothetical protein